jgi:t-SNARE complex subunit (syntaxin)
MCLAGLLKSYGDSRGGGVGGTQAGSMEEFFKVVEIVKKNIVAIRDTTKIISDIIQELVLSTTESQEENASQGLADLIAKGNKNAKTAQGLLKDLNKEVKVWEDTGKNLPELRIRKNLVQTLTKKYIDVLKEYQNVQNKAKEVKKKRAVKRVQQVKPDATPQEINAVIQSGNAGEIIKQTILQGDAADVIRNAYESATSKYQDVLKLEASVAELAQMFQDFALIVEQQGELLDQIEYQVKSASDYVDEGNQQMVEAIDLQKSIRKKQCCCAVLILVVIAIIIAIIVVVTKR